MKFSNNLKVYNGSGYEVVKLENKLLYLDEKTNQKYFLEEIEKEVDGKTESAWEKRYLVSRPGKFDYVETDDSILYFNGRINEGRIISVEEQPQSAKTPVTYLNIQDVKIWCNAASEKEGLEPVYYIEGTTDFTDKSKVCRFGVVGEYELGPTDHCVVNENSNGYRLPTDHEWEFAARGGDPIAPEWNYLYSGSNNLDEVAWYFDNALFSTHQIGTKKPNSAGIYDMNGNVSEFVYHKMIDNYKQTWVRGGCYETPGSFISVESANYENNFGRHLGGGFRIARSLVE